ncbi:hypothetical protein M2273_004161 [Mucilaginibacter lappiensis]
MFREQCKRPHPTLSKGEGYKIFFKVSPFGGDLEGGFASCLAMTRGENNDLLVLNTKWPPC